MKSNYLLTTALLFVIVFFSGCKKDDFVESKSLCPEVVSTNPANNSTGVDVTQNIFVKFNTDLAPESVNAQAFSLSARSNANNTVTSIAGVVSYDATNKTLVFDPTNDLPANSTFTGRVETSIKDPRGNRLQQVFTWTFSTNVPPFVMSTDPANNATNVPINKVIEVIFSQPMNPTTINSTTFNLKAGTNTIAGTIVFANNRLLFTPSASLATNTVYTGTVTTGAKSISNISMSSNFTWSFTTAAAPSPAPFVMSTDPANNATNVPTNKVIEVIFSQTMDPSTINSSTFNVKTGANTVAGNIAFSNNRLLFTPSANLAANTLYTGTVTTGARSAANVAMTNDFTWSFTTAAAPSPPPPFLGTGERFGIFAATGISNNAGFSKVINFDVGITPGARSSVTGFPPGEVVGGAIFASDDVNPSGTAAMLNQAKNDINNAYLDLQSRTSPSPVIVSGDIGGTIRTPGIYKSNTSLLIQNGNLTLDAQGNTNAVWIFQIGSSLTTGGPGGNIILINGAQAKNIYWQVGSSATIGDNTNFRGNILALTSITLNSNAIVTGRTLVLNGAVTLTNTNTITKP